MDDLIKRKDAQRLFGIALTHKERQGKFTWTTVEVKQFIADFVEDLPSIQPKTGKWSGADGLYGCGIYICDNCGKFAMIKSDYCPNCGAKMEVEQ